MKLFINIVIKLSYNTDISKGDILKDYEEIFSIITNTSRKHVTLHDKYHSGDTSDRGRKYAKRRNIIPFLAI